MGCTWNISILFVSVIDKLKKAVDWLISKIKMNEDNNIYIEAKLIKKYLAKTH